jgi:hypothetical protein
MKIEYRKIIKLSQMECHKLFELANFAILPYVGLMTEDQGKVINMFIHGNSALEPRQMERISELFEITEEIVQNKRKDMEEADGRSSTGLIPDFEQYRKNLIVNYDQQLESIAEMRKILTVEDLSTFDDEEIEMIEH